MPTVIWYSTDDETQTRFKIEIDSPPWTFPDTADLAVEAAELCAADFTERDNDWPDEGCVEFYLFRDDKPETAASWHVSVQPERTLLLTGYGAERLPRQKTLQTATKEDTGLQVSDLVVFELGTDGTNRIYAQVQAGGAHEVPKEELERTARRFAYSEKLETLVRELARAPVDSEKLSSIEYLVRKAIYLCEDMDEGN